MAQPRLGRKLQGARLVLKEAEGEVVLRALFVWVLFVSECWGFGGTHRPADASRTHPAPIPTTRQSPNRNLNQRALLRKHAYEHIWTAAMFLWEGTGRSPVTYMFSACFFCLFVLRIWVGLGVGGRLDRSNRDGGHTDPSSPLLNQSQILTSYHRSVLGARSREVKGMRARARA